MEKIFVCPSCGNLRDLNNCDTCAFEIKKNNGIYLFLDKQTDFDEIGKYYYNYENQENGIEIARGISEVLGSGIILDLGCGDGFISRYLLKYDYQILGLDSSIVMLELFKDKLGEALDVTNKLTLIKTDANNIPLASEKVDLVVVNNLFHLLNNPQNVLNEIYRVLKVDGKLVLISELFSNYYKVFGKDKKLYSEIISKYQNIYWELLKEHNIYPNKYNKDFNPYLEANKLFSRREVFRSRDILYEGVKTIKEFLIKESKKSEYSKLKVPLDVHSKIHSKIVNLLKTEYGSKLENIEVKYKGKNTFVFDVYRK